MAKWGSFQGCKVVSVWRLVKVIHHINGLKKKNHMIISFNAIFFFHKIQHLFIIKTSRKIGIEGNLLNLIKSIYKNPTVNIVLSGERLNPFPLRSGTRISAFIIPIQHSAWSSSQCYMARKRNIRHTDHKGRDKTISICRWYDCAQNPVETTEI